jgi:hypothetical protein
MRLRTAVATLLVLGCGSESTGSTPQRVGADEVRGRWTFQVQSNPECPGGANVGAIVLTLSGGEVFFGGASLGARGRWTNSGPLVGEVTGLVGLDQPVSMFLHLTVEPPIDAMMTEVAGLQGTVDEDFHFTGRLIDPDDLGFVNQRPIFSSVACTYAVQGDHSTASR